MRAVDIIIKKRDGGVLTDEEIRYFIDAYTAGEIGDDQAAALMMSIFFRGMDYDETTALTLAMAESGKQVDLSGIKGVKVDKHSTGGIGDKTTMIVGPITAACGVPVAKMSGRALGFTGGTIDKLESIPGLSTSIPIEKMVEIVNDTGICVAGQTLELAPADKKLYALRDVTGSIESIPLIAASIMSKKIAAGADAIVLDVKYGSGAFMKTKADAKALADTMCGIGEKAGRRTVAVLNSMEEPLGMCIGNTIEVKESVETLKGGGSEDLKKHCFELAAHMISLGLGIGFEEAEAMALKSVEDGSALRKFAQMIKVQGGDPSVCDDPDAALGIPKYSYVIRAEKDGSIEKCDAYSIGMAAYALGVGRTSLKGKIDPRAGVKLIVKSGVDVKKGDGLCVLYSDSPVSEEAIERASSAYIYR
jgi:pyrimidine-nucleoside phosphorylase